jgi:hypothetical protein
VYRDIAKYLSNHCVAENAEYAVMEMLRNAAPGTIEDIMRVFNYSPVEGMNLAVAWTIENSLRNQQGAIETESIEPGDSGQYLVSFRGGKAVTSSEWINEYGIWRIRRFGEFAAGNPDFVREREERYQQAAKLRTNLFFSFIAGYSHILGRGPALDLESDFHLWLFSFGTQIYYAGSSFLQGEGTVGLYFPIRMKDKIAITPFTGAALGFVWKDTEDEKGLFNLNDSSTIMDLALSARGGIRLTTSLVPGLFLQAAYQYSKALPSAPAEKNSHLFSLGIGYGF